MRFKNFKNTVKQLAGDATKRKTARATLIATDGTTFTINVSKERINDPKGHLSAFDYGFNILSGKKNHGSGNIMVPTRVSRRIMRDAASFDSSGFEITSQIANALADSFASTRT